MASPPPASMQHLAPSSVAPYHPPPTYPPPVGSRPVVTDGKAAASLVWAILGMIFGLPLGLPGMIAGPVAYFLGKGALERIAASNGALTGRSAASAGRILGIVATAVGAIVTLVWLVLILNALNDSGTTTSAFQLERVTDAFAWPVRDPEWPVKILITGLILLIPIAGQINGLGWMLATLDRLRAGEERLAPANLSYLGRGVRLFAVQLVYSLAVALVALVIYLPAVLIAVEQGQGKANAGLIVVSLLLNLLAFGVMTIGSLALTFATPAIVLATDRGGVVGGLTVREIIRRSRANPTNTLIAGLMLIAAGLISSLGVIACFVGVLFTTAYALAVQAWVYRSFESGSYAGSEPAA